MTTTAPPTTRSLVISVFVLTISRLIVNMSRRFPYPFLPAIARQLTVPLSSVQTLMAVQAGIGVSSPLFGPLAERFGRKRVMMGALLLMSVMGFIGALLPVFSIYALVMLGFGLAKMIFDPALLAYLGDRVSYKRRGLAIGTTELSWAGSLIFAAPIAGFLLSLSIIAPVSVFILEVSGLDNVPGLLRNATGLQAILLLLSGLSLLALVNMWLFLPSDKPAKDAARSVITPFSAWPILRRNPAARGALAYAVLFQSANEVFFINYGAWMEISFELLLATLGTATTVIAIAEVFGEFAVIGIADRIGKRRLALIGAGISSLSYVLLPILSFNITVALIGLFIMFLFVEIGIVASIPLFTEVVPDNRAIMMSSVTGAASLGRLSGAVLGGFLFSAIGSFVIIGLTATIIGLTAFFMLWYYVQENDTD